MSRLFGHDVDDPFFPKALREVLVVVVVGDADDEALAVFLQLIRQEVVRDVIRHHDRPLDVPHQGVELVMLVPQGVEAADEAAHAGARDDVDRDAEFFHIFDDAQMRKATGAAAGQDEAHRGAVLADGVHPGADLGKGDRIDLGIGAGKDLGMQGSR